MSPPSPCDNSNIIEEAFGQGCDLYSTVLQCSKDATKAALRKAYYRAALQHHPDRHPDDPDGTHKLKFQAISQAYQILGNDDLRAEYDETGVIPGQDHDDGDDKDFSAWKDYFSTIFGSVTTSKIDAFASKYKCSEEEKRDVIKYFSSQKGNLVKVLECVMLSEPRDCQRWVEDFLEPAFKAGELDAKLRPAMEKSLAKTRLMVEKENLEEQDDEDSEEEDPIDDEETETEESDTEQKRPSPKARAVPPKKASKPPAKHSKKKPAGDMDSLVAAIRNKQQQGASAFANLAMRYGAKLEDDPLSDEAFAKTQATLGNKKRRK